MVNGNPASMTVAVLNAISINGFAPTALARLTAVGFPAGRVANATGAARPRSVVEYTPHHQLDAVAVSQELKLNLSSIEPLTTTT